MNEITIERVRGRETEPYLEDLAKLRIRVFREFPYLYEGSLAYEAKYLRDYARSERATVVLAREGTKVIGAATAMPLSEHGEAVAPALITAGYAADDVYYFGESVLLSEYRGRRIGHAFFDHRESAAREFGFRVTTFCAVVRPEDHPMRPKDYVPHDVFWSKRGYTKRPDIVANFAWRDLGDERESEKPMVFWIKELRP